MARNSTTGAAAHVRETRWAMGWEIDEEATPRRAKTAWGGTGYEVIETAGMAEVREVANGVSAIINKSDNLHAGINFAVAVEACRTKRKSRN